MSAPTCPNTACGAKFALDREKDRCKRCGLPGSVASEGPRAVARWVHRSRTAVVKGQVVELSKAQSKLTVIGGSAGRRRKKHGMRR